MLMVQLLGITFIVFWSTCDKIMVEQVLSYFFEPPHAKHAVFPATHLVKLSIVLTLPIRHIVLTADLHLSYFD